MQTIAEFYKVSFSQFLQDWKKCWPETSDEDIQTVKTYWEKIQIPARATAGSAGYDFYVPVSFFLEEGKSVTIPTGIRAEMQPGWVLLIFPRSGLGFKHGMRLANSTGIIDEDYAHADNEGHIMVKFSADKNMCLQEGDRFVQGIFLPYGVTASDRPISERRTGGFGSTGA